MTTKKSHDIIKGQVRVNFRDIGVMQDFLIQPNGFVQFTTPHSNTGIQAIQLNIHEIELRDSDEKYPELLREHLLLLDRYKAMQNQNEKLCDRIAWLQATNKPHWLKRIFLKKRG